ncbi:hypothetical protein [Paenibacillus wenxiniae]|uniref:Uncharacterized protein n=1 Tax=Paenibacillus wenxiniae TaxID=1636843 RepID=A0ABW4RF37_9BACL
MNMQSLYNSYIGIKYRDQKSPDEIHHHPFQYEVCEDDSTELFIRDAQGTAFSEWAFELMPADPGYLSAPVHAPLLAQQFPQLDLHDELILHYLLLTINTTLSIYPLNRYNRMNDWMKGYCFFQLSGLNQVTLLTDEQRQQIRGWLLYQYLYAHPVNEETLQAFSYKEQHLIHTATDISVRDYMTRYHDEIQQHYEQYADRLNIPSNAVEPCKALTLELLSHLEGSAMALQLPNMPEVSYMLPWLNDVNRLLEQYRRDKQAFFAVLRQAAMEPPNAYHAHCFGMLLQNYACYILSFDPAELHVMVDALVDEPDRCTLIISRLFIDTIFVQHILWQHGQTIHEMPQLIAHFNDEAKELYGLK